MQPLQRRELAILRILPALLLDRHSLVRLRDDGVCRLCELRKQRGNPETLRNNPALPFP
ncbi:hypothetical protein [Nitrosomonas eutropha]|uniref:hypothetical protein n=1 Tax=Nitrosomonas eutropha TaxID=916 RepID=UPI0015A4873F|nr:hypothetical protein [Nitrosomonas eutropha]